MSPEPRLKPYVTNFEPRSLRRGIIVSECCRALSESHEHASRPRVMAREGTLTRRYFGTDGIRGRANTHPMTPDVAMRVGMAVGLHYRNGHRQSVVIGKDTRLSGYMIENALTAGFLSVGVDVFLLGPIPTPGGRHAHPLASRRLRRDDLRLAQSLRRQRHQALRAGRLQALRRGGGADRGADRFRHELAAREVRRSSAGRSASTGRSSATSRPRSARCRGR